jgi:hypothetical protein
VFYVIINFTCRFWPQQKTGKIRNIATILSDNRRGFRLVIGLMAHLYTQLAATNNYSAIANSHILQFTTAHTVFSVCCVFASRCPVTDPNNVLWFRSQVLAGWQLSHNWLTTHNLLLNVVSARTALKACLPKVLLLLHHVAIARTPWRTPLVSYSIVECL